MASAAPSGSTAATGTGAGAGIPGPGRSTSSIPKLRKGSYMPSLLEPRRRAEQALVSVVCQAYVEGVSTRRVDDLVRSMGIDWHVQVRRVFRTAPRTSTPRWPSSATVPSSRRALHLRVARRALPQGCERAAVWSRWATVIASRVSMPMVTARCSAGRRVHNRGRSRAGWPFSCVVSFARGSPSGVALVVSDAHEGLKNAIGKVLRK